MINIKNKVDCSGCFGCISICPKECIEMKSDKEGFLYPKVDHKKCIKCGACDRVCLIKNDLKLNEANIKAYACKNKNNEVRKNSSSGGIFYLLCEEVINKNGVVFGAAFDEKFEVKHMYAETLEECNKFRGSKYVQSLIGENYKKAKFFLESGRIVLFSGTQCQIKGLNLYLGKQYKNLITIDIVCHGVPSPKVFKIYKESLKKEFNAKINDIKFRDKKNGWKNYNYTVKFSDSQIFSENFAKNIYMKGFLKDLYLRPACYKCRAKNNKSGSDITLADYWGIEHKHPEFDDDKGTSLILLKSLKGRKILDSIIEKIDIIETDLDYAVKNNPSIIKSVNYNKKRSKFFKKIQCNDLESAIEKTYKVTFADKCINKIVYESIKIKNKVVK